MPVPPHPPVPVIDLEDEEESASAIVDGLRRMLEAERQAHGAMKETCERLKKECSDAERGCVELKETCERLEKECSDTTILQLQLTAQQTRHDQERGELSSMYGVKEKEVSRLQSENNSLSAQLDLMEDREQLGNLIWEKVRRTVRDEKECSDGKGVAFDEEYRRYYSYQIENGEYVGVPKWEDDPYVCKETWAVDESILPGGSGFKAAVKKYKRACEGLKASSACKPRPSIAIGHEMIDREIELCTEIEKVAVAGKKRDHAVKVKEEKENARIEKTVKSCMEMLINRTIRCTPREYKYPPGEWDNGRDRAVYHEGCFVDCERFQAGVDYVGVNIDHSVMLADGKRRNNHQVFFSSIEKAQGYYRSLPKTVEFANDARDAAMGARGEEEKHTHSGTRDTRRKRGKRYRGGSSDGQMVSIGRGTRDSLYPDGGSRELGRQGGRALCGEAVRQGAMPTIQ